LTAIEQAQELATQWLWRYNNERPHTGIGGVPPKAVITGSLNSTNEHCGKWGDYKSILAQDIDTALVLKT